MSAHSMHTRVWRVNCSRLNTIEDMHHGCHAVGRETDCYSVHGDDASGLSEHH